MRILVMTLFVTALAFTPVYMLDHLVMPELLSLKESYSSFDQTAQQVAQSKPDNR